jgi:hypothetical protein
MGIKQEGVRLLIEMAPYDFWWREMNESQHHKSHLRIQIFCYPKIKILS